MASELYENQKWTTTLSRHLFTHKPTNSDWIKMDDDTLLGAYSLVFSIRTQRTNNSSSSGSGSGRKSQRQQHQQQQPVAVRTAIRVECCHMATRWHKHLRQKTNGNKFYIFSGDLWIQEKINLSSTSEWIFFSDYSVRNEWFQMKTVAPVGERRFDCQRNVSGFRSCHIHAHDIQSTQTNVALWNDRR